MKNIEKIAFLSLVLLLSVSIKAMAQDGPPTDPGVPFDGLSLALVAGVGYGAKRLFKKGKAEKDEKEKTELEKK